MRDTTNMKWRPMAPADLPAINEIAKCVHPDYPERPEIFAERLSLYPQGCHALIEGDSIRGYVLSHPWRSFDPPALDSLLDGLPSRVGTYYLHDISILPRARGRGLADPIIESLIAAARSTGFASMSLVAVNDSVEFWMRRGFEIVETPELAHRLATYDGEARFMVLALK